MPGASEILGFLGGVLRKNLGLKLLALGIAVVMWWLVAGESKIQVGFIIPLEIRNVPQGMAIANKVQRDVEVRLTGPPSLLGNLPPSEVSAAVDLSDARPGRMSVPLDPVSVRVPPGIKVQRVYPSVIDVDLQRLERRELPVEVRLPPQLRKKIRQVEVVPAKLPVEALASDFDSLHRLQTEEVVPDVDSGIFTSTARVEVREGHARIVGTQSVRVTVRFRQQATAGTGD